MNNLKSESNPIIISEYFSPVKEINEEQISSDGKIEEDETEYKTERDESYDSRSEWKSVLKCPKCDEDFENKSSFLEHLQLYREQIKLCPDCQKLFHNFFAFQFHKQLDMCFKLSKMLKCKLCKKTIYGSSQYDAHLRAHKRNQCKTCGNHFATRKHLEAHSSNVHKSTLSKDSFRCHLCDRTFAQRRSLIYHYKITHPDYSLLCPVCLGLFDTASQLEVHKTTHKLQTFTCDKCNAQFSRRQQYIVHLQDHDRYKCRTCNATFSAKKTAINHMQKGHQISGLDPQLQCAQCGLLFCSRAQLNKHMDEHGEQTFACEKCKITFKNKSNYKSHLQTNEHLRGEELKNIFSCKFCSKTFVNKNNLRVHISRMHKANVKEHSCMHCSYKTTVINNLKRHIALHTEKPKFICDKCGSQLQSKNALQEHDVQVHSNKEFSCEKCGKLFGRSSDLNRHLLTTHSDVPLHPCHCGNKYKTLSNLKRHQLLSHGKVESKQNRLKKLFQSENRDSEKKKVKKQKKKPKHTTKINADLDLLVSTMSAEPISSTKSTISTVSLMPPVTTIPSNHLVENNYVTTIAINHPSELLKVVYNKDFTSDNKSHIVCANNFDMNSLHVVESMIPIESDTIKPGSSVLIDVRNSFGSEKLKFICNKCGSQLVSKNAFQEHELQVHANKEFTCEEHKKLFGRPSDLNSRLLTTNPDVPLHPCHCGNSYNTLSDLKQRQLSHGKEESKQILDKLFQPASREPTKNRNKNKKNKTEKITPIGKEDLMAPIVTAPHMISTGSIIPTAMSIPTVPTIPSTIIVDNNSVNTMAVSNSPELLEVVYNMDFTSDDKSHIVYAQNIDVNSLHVVESMIQLDGDASKPGTSVLINVRNLFGRPITSDYNMQSSTETNIVNSLDDTLTLSPQHITANSQKQDVISSLHDFIIPHDLNFLNT